MINVALRLVVDLKPPHILPGHANSPVLTSFFHPQMQSNNGTYGDWRRVKRGQLRLFLWTVS